MSKKEDLEKKKKVEQLKAKAEKVKKSAAQMQRDSEQRFEKAMGRKMNAEERKDAWLENQTAKRYEDVGVSPIYSKGNFSRKSKMLDEKYGNRLTEDDIVPSISKRKKRY